MQNERGQGISHANEGGSVLPSSAQRKVPEGVERNVPNTLHDTSESDSTTRSHATGKSIVPEPIQKAVPEKLERALPNAIHDTGDRGTQDTGVHRSSK